MRNHGTKSTCQPDASPPETCSSEKRPSEKWPPELDALSAAAAHHKLLMENDQVRVLETFIPAGEQTAVHTHRWPAVQYVQAWSDFLGYDGDGNLIFDSRTAPAPAIGAALWSGPYGPHSVRNIGSGDLKVLVVEIKKRE